LVFGHGSRFFLRGHTTLLNHVSNLQTLHDIVSNWPTILKDAALIVGSNWFLPSLGILCLVFWGVLGYAERHQLKNNDGVIQAEQADRIPSQSVQPTIMYDYPIQDFSDPAYDPFFPIAWRKRLIKEGQDLMERWTTRLDYPEKQRRESDSINWLSELNQYARKNLKDEQLDEFMTRYKGSINPAKKYEFSMALNKAETQAGTQEHDIAFEIAGKVKLLERYRDSLTQPS
jgi:hypothetical protein